MRRQPDARAIQRATSVQFAQFPAKTRALMRAPRHERIGPVKLINHSVNEWRVKHINTGMLEQVIQHKPPEVLILCDVLASYHKFMLKGRTAQP